MNNTSSQNESLKKSLLHHLRRAKNHIRNRLPHSLKEKNPSLRKYGAINDLYPWISDGEIDTTFYIYNHHSVYYPHLDTRTKVNLWWFDSNGVEIGKREFELGVLETKQISVATEKSIFSSPSSVGTLLWHISVPKAVLDLPECTKGHAYFADRSYYCFTKGKSFAAFVHGIDRYAVFQKGVSDKYDLFYGKKGNYSWFPEIPFGSNLGCQRVEIITTNRCASSQAISLRLRNQSGQELFTHTSEVAPRGVFRYVASESQLAALGPNGSFDLHGLPTQWTRVMLLMHFSNGAITLMHC